MAPSSSTPRPRTFLVPRSPCWAASQMVAGCAGALARSPSRTSPNVRTCRDQRGRSIRARSHCVTTGWVDHVVRGTLPRASCRSAVDDTCIDAHNCEPVYVQPNLTVHVSPYADSKSPGWVCEPERLGWCCWLGVLLALWSR